MRGLIKNTVPLWYVEPTQKVEKTDVDGNYTGVFETLYSSPVLVRISLYPISSSITREIFGEDLNISFVSNSKLNFKQDGFFFKDEPTEKYYETYDYKITAIQPSINTTQYGLEVR